MCPTFQQCIARILPLCLLSGGLAQAWAGQVQLAWNAPTTHTDGTPATDLAGYALYWHDSTGVPQRVDVGNQTTYTLTGLPGGTTSTVDVTAYDTAGTESSPSNTLTVPVPLAVAAVASTPVGTPVTLAVLANDTDPTGLPLTITTVTQGANGTVTSNGTTVTYTPAATFVGTDRFTYTITDGQGASSTAPVTVTVTPVTQPPVAMADAAATPVGTPLTLAVLANDTDPTGLPLTITTVTQGANGTVTSNGTTVTYTPVATFVGTDRFTYTITDSQGASSTATVTITVFVQVPFEAEVGTLTAPMAVGTETTTTPAVQYVWVPQGTANILDPLQQGGAVQYTFAVPKADGYVVWGRVSPNTTGTGSFFLGLDVPGGPGSNGLLTNVAPTTYQVATLHVGDRYYVDSAATITALPPGLDGLGAIKTANANKGNTHATFLTFTLWQDATLYVAYNAKVAAFPTWLTASFTNTGQLIQTTNGPMAVWTKAVPAGPVALPGNKYQEPYTVRSQYFVLLAFQGPVPYLVWDVTPPQASGTSPQPWVWDQAATTTTPVFFLGAGSHTLTIRQRESGTKLDKLLITNNLTLLPQ